MKNLTIAFMTTGIAFIGGVLIGPHLTVQAEQMSLAVWVEVLKKESAIEIEAKRGLLKDEPQLILDLVDSYRTAAQSQDGVKGLLANSLNWFYVRKPLAGGVPTQISQIAAETQLRLSTIQIQQNQRIIALLEELAKKR